jgi:hypothetical protein
MSETLNKPVKEVDASKIMPEVLTAEVEMPIVEYKISNKVESRQMSNWHIIHEGDGISARNMVTQEVFRGSVADFCSFLRS